MKKLLLLLLLSAVSIYSQAILKPNGPGNTYEEITNILAPGMDTLAVEDPQCIHPGRHIAELWDSELNKYVYEYYIHTAIDNDRCINFDRQRVEIKTYDASPANLKGTLGETITYKWKFRVPVGFQPSTSFTHIHQIKAVGGNDGDPIFTLTARKSTPNKLELIHDNTTKVAIVNLSLFEGNWVECTEVVKVGAAGTYSLIIKKVSDGTVLLNYSNNNLLTIRPDNDFVRPKWGIYRSLDHPEDLRDETLRFADFYIAEETASTLPNVPTLVSATPISATGINLTWTDNSTNEESFRIERSLNNSTWAFVTNAEPNSTTFADTLLNKITLYYYRIRSENLFGNSAYSNVISATTPNTAARFISSGNTNLWSTQTWVPDGVPGAIDTVVLAHDLTIDSDVSVGVIKINAGNTETINSARNIYGNIIINGALNISGAISVNMNGDITCSGASASIKFSSNGARINNIGTDKVFTLSDGASFTQSNSTTFSSTPLAYSMTSMTWSVDNSSALTNIIYNISGNTAVTTIPNSQVFGNFRFTTSTTPTSSKTITFSSNISILGDFSIACLSATTAWPYIWNLGSYSISTSGSGKVITVSQAASHQFSINISGTNAFTGFSSASFYPPSNGNCTVSYNAAADQNIAGGSYQKLKISGGSIKSLSGDVSVSDSLSITGTVISLGAYNLTMGASSLLSGTPSASNMIAASGTGELRKVFTAPGSYLFPVGDLTSGSEYSPVTVTLNSADGFSGGLIGVNVNDSKHPNNTSISNYLSRYWGLSISGITNPNYTAVFNYVDADINGIESNIYGGRYSSGWTLFSQVNTAANSFTISSLNGGGQFTGGESSALPVELSSFAANASSDGVSLRWLTSTELNNNGFEVWRKKENSNWESISFIKGAGSSNTTKEYNYLDRSCASGINIYRLKQIDNNGSYNYSSEVEVLVEVPKSLNLSQNYPNPFNPSTLINFEVPLEGHVSLIIYDALGREASVLINEFRAAGRYQHMFDGHELSSGIYFCRLNAGNTTLTRKMILSK